MDRITNGGTNKLALRGLEKLFSSCAVVSVFGSGGKKVLVLHTHVRYLTFFGSNIFLIVVEVLRYFVRQFW